jgi:hypothetical protein
LALSSHSFTSSLVKPSTWLVVEQLAKRNRLAIHKNDNNLMVESFGVFKVYNNNGLKPEIVDEKAKSGRFHPLSGKCRQIIG